MFTIENFIRGIINATRNLNATILDNMFVVKKLAMTTKLEQTKRNFLLKSQ